MILGVPLDAVVIVDWQDLGGMQGTTMAFYAHLSAGPMSTGMKVPRC